MMTIIETGKQKWNGKNKTSQVLALGNCDGKILLYDIDSQFEGNGTNSPYFQFDNIINMINGSYNLSKWCIKLREKNWRMPTWCFKFD